MEPCIYCGAIATDRDHTIPCTIRGRRSFEDEWVWSCRSCNSLLSTFPISSISKRAEYILKKLRRKYKGILKYIYWTDKELKSIEPNLRRIIKNKLIMGNELRDRIEHLEMIASFDI